MTGQIVPWFNDRATYVETGRRAARARRRRDESLCHSFSQWFERALRLEDASLRAEARRAFTEGYQEEGATPL